MSAIGKLARYREISLLGSGATATVVLAEDATLGRLVALKRVHPLGDAGRHSRVRREALIGAGLSHPNLVSVYDVLAGDDGAPVIVMEYVEGETLRNALQRGAGFAVGEAVRVIGGVGAGLDAIHRRGVVHRDVKPANILLGTNGAIKLADLGIASAADRTRITMDGAVLGTFSYMAPEQLEGDRPTTAIDVYALAAVAFEVLSGRKARLERNPLALAHALATRPPPDLREAWPQAPRAAVELLARGLSREPDRRPRSAGELAGRLRAALEAHTTRPVRGSPGARSGGLTAQPRSAPLQTFYEHELADAPGGQRQTPPGEGAARANRRIEARAARPSSPSTGAKSAAGQPRGPQPLAITTGTPASAQRRADAATAAASEAAASQSASRADERHPVQSAGLTPVAWHRGSPRKPVLVAIAISFVAAAVLLAVLINARPSPRPASRPQHHSSSPGARPRTTTTTNKASHAPTDPNRATPARPPAATGATPTDTAPPPRATRPPASATTPPPAIPAPTSRAGSPPATKSATAPASPTGGSPVAAVESFYTLAAAHRYSEAWALADPTFRAQLGGYDSFQAGQAHTRSITFNAAHLLNRSTATATVAIQTTSTHTNGTQHCTGTVDLVSNPASAAWLLHLIHINCT